MNILSGTLIYFSPTGTTKKYATTIADSLNLRDIREIDLTKPENRNFDSKTVNSHMVIIGFPVYEEYAPEIFINALNRIGFNNQPAIAFSVYGKIGFGLSLKQIAKILNNKKLRTIALGAFIAEHSFSTIENPLAPGRPDKNDLEDAANISELFLSRLKSDSAPLCHEAIPGRLPLMARILPKNSAKHFTKTPIVNLEKCNKCRLCVIKCPVNAIDQNMNINEQLCIRCFACVKACKLFARKIEYKKEFLVKMMFRKNEKKSKKNIII